VCFCRRRPFLIRPLENTLVKLILSLEFYSQEGRQKIAIGAHLLSTGLSSTPAFAAGQAVNLIAQSKS